jgi:hypothetical protein
MSESLSQPEVERPLAPPIVLEAGEAFRRDLPELLKERPGQWVAYYGAQRLGFSTSKTTLWNECLRQGYEDFIVVRIWPYPESDFISAL